jgi:hypothetical protein
MIEDDDPTFEYVRGIADKTWSVSKMRNCFMDKIMIYTDNKVVCEKCERIFIAEISNIKKYPALDGDLFAAPVPTSRDSVQVIVDEQQHSIKKKVRYLIFYILRQLLCSYLETDLRNEFISESKLNK